MFNAKAGYEPGDHGKGRVLADEAEAEIFRRRSDCAAAALPVADEVRYVGPVLACEHVNAANLGDTNDPDAVRNQRHAFIAAGSPLPDVAPKFSIPFELMP